MSLQLKTIITQVSQNKEQSESTPKSTPKRTSMFVKRPKFLNLIQALCQCFSSDDVNLSQQESFEQQLPVQTPQNEGKKTLILDIDETLVHSSFKLFGSPDIELDIEMEEQLYRVYTHVRPGVSQLFRKLEPFYELAVFTASISKYADPLMDILDEENLVTHRLFRESCALVDGQYVKDLARLGRDLKDIVIVDNSPHSYMLQPENAVPIKSWFGDRNDQELFNLIPFLQQLSESADVRTKLSQIGYIPPVTVKNNPVGFEKDDIESRTEESMEEFASQRENCNQTVSEDAVNISYQEDRDKFNVNSPRTGGKNVFGGKQRLNKSGFV